MFHKAKQYICVVCSTYFKPNKLYNYGRTGQGLEVRTLYDFILQKRCDPHPSYVDRFSEIFAWFIFFPWNALISKMYFVKKFPEPLLRSPRLLTSNSLETQNDENSKWKLVKTRWNPESKKLVFVKVWLENRAIAHFSQLDALI